LFDNNRHSCFASFRALPRELLGELLREMELWVRKKPTDLYV